MASSGRLEGRNMGGNHWWQHDVTSWKTLARYDITSSLIPGSDSTGNQSIKVCGVLGNDNVRYDSQWSTSKKCNEILNLYGKTIDIWEIPPVWWCYFKVQPEVPSLPVAFYFFCWSREYWCALEPKGRRLPATPGQMTSLCVSQLFLPTPILD